MDKVKEMLSELHSVCADPRAQLEAALARGRKAVGVLPYFCPEELVYAAGMLPFGLWGAEMQTSLSGRYYPAFTCSLLHTALEMGLRGQLAGLSAIMVPLCCDSLKCFGPNWKYGVGTVPVIDVAWAQNRKTEAGEEFTRARFRRVLGRLEEISGKTVSDGEIAEACRLSQADEFIRSFPEGYETKIEQGGTNVSGGQKQRLCIARALLKRPKILILDDSTSAVDTHTDARIRAGFKTYIPETTKIIIAQRVASVQDADLILVMDNGRIAAAGTHDELMQSSDIYREVYDQQTNGGDEE